MAAPRIRIFSDLHFGDSRSTVTRLEMLTPLFAEADELVLNGDTLDTLVPGHVPRLAAVRAFLAATGRPFTFLSGNHDPDISDRAELLLAEGRVWVTHGDVLFDHIAPWSHHAPVLIRLLDEIARAADAHHAPTPPSLTERLRRHRLASIALMSTEDFLPHFSGPRALRFLRTLFPPRRLLAILRAWRDTPHLAVELARRHHPSARVVILGHTHYPGVWSPASHPGLRVINTGAFAHPLGGTFIELHGERVQVRRILRRADSFRPGRVLADFTLPATTPA